MTATKAPAFKAAMETVLRAAFASDPVVRVTYGLPDELLGDDYVMLGSTRTTWAPAVIYQGRPQRDEELRLIVVISCTVAGGQAAQKPATERAFALLDVLDDAIWADRTLGGVVRSAELEDAEAPEEEAYTDDGGSVYGRMCSITLTVKAKARV